MEHDIEVPVVARDPREGVPDLPFRSFEQLHEDLAPADERAGHAITRVAPARVEENPRKHRFVVTERLRGIDDAQEIQEVLSGLKAVPGVRQTGLCHWTSAV